ncbi:MAG: glucosamine-6-phosphate deaminase [Chitinophagaceae bacterium]|nr:glucosamine-6-phosphate deaminase [Chitinophagaceae bacterium]
MLQNIQKLLENTDIEFVGTSEEEQTRFEKIPTRIVKTSEDASKQVAIEISHLIQEKAKKGEQCVLGLATGSTPTKVYNELIRLHREENLSFKNVITFNLDEYYPIQPTELQSYVRFMDEYLFNHIDIIRDNIHIPDGTIKREEMVRFCEKYENLIEKSGGIDLQILGIGKTGHIGFNEPGSSMRSKTRLITLDRITKIDASSDFFSEENVPHNAITIGLGTIMRARKIILMAWGEGKASIIKKAVEGSVSEEIPASCLQLHPNVCVILDEASSADLKRVSTPWLVGEIKWNYYLTKKAVIWLSQNLKKPILKLTDRDYADYGMGELITQHGSAYQINIHFFNDLQSTITGWPGGKPNADDSTRPERAHPVHKRIIIFSPHPDDDVISMGGTFIRLVDQKHEVHVAYQTSGNIAVFDDDVIRFADFYTDLSKEFGKGTKDSLYKKVKELLESKKQGEVDTPEILKIKGFIRRSEAKAACRYVGIPDNQVYFLNLPFYETGKVKKKPIGTEDISIITELIKKIKPHQIFAAGDLSDPHGTHRVCLDAIFSSIDILKTEEFMKDCWVWLYRGAWQEWGIENIQMAIPISPDELMRKRKAIFKHQSQKDSAVFPGHDKREFWQKAEERNISTAQTYNQLGLAEYEAIEAFKRYYF